MGGRRITVRWAWGAVVCVLCAPAAGQPVSAARLRAHVKFLASDLLEGRGAVERGGALATEYLATQFELAGLKPAGDGGSYFQRVPVVGVTTRPESVWVVSSGSEELRLRWLEDVVGATQRQGPAVEFSGEVVFAGYGITAPEFGWDDYAGADVGGKVLLVFANEPRSTERKFFDGEALTYYGRCRYKFEQAARRGAAGVILIHTDETAGHGWDVVQSSWGREALQPEVSAGRPALGFAGWMTREAGERVVALAGRTVGELLAAAGRRGFRATPLGIRLRGSVRSAVRKAVSRNVAAMTPGSDPAVEDEAVVFTAHWDHLGIGPEVNGDSIYNGAVDNATGCAILIELARHWALLERKPRRAALFLATTAEESGLLGAQYYADHPVFAPGRTAAALNFDSYFPWGMPGSVAAGGAERTTVWPLATQAARRLQLEIRPDPGLRQGSYFRSDHFPFAQAGIPAFLISLGTDFAGRSAEEIERRRKEFVAKDYHRPSDEYREEWDFSGLAEVVRFGFLLGRMIADAERLPTWNPGEPMRTVREAQRKRAIESAR